MDAYSVIPASEQESEGEEVNRKQQRSVAVAAHAAAALFDEMGWQWSLTGEQMFQPGAGDIALAFANLLEHVGPDDSAGTGRLQVVADGDGGRTLLVEVGHCDEWHCDE